MEKRESDRGQWGGRQWVLAAVAVVLAVLIMVVVLQRPLAWVTPAPTPLPWTAQPGLYVIPTQVPPTPTPVPQPTVASPWKNP